MITIKIEKEFMEWIITLLNVIIKELKEAGILSENTKFLRQKIKSRKRNSHSIKVMKDIETEYVVLNIQMKMIKDSFLLGRKVIQRIIPVLVGFKSFFNIFNNKDNEINEEFQLFRNIWKDRYVYYIFTLPEDKDKFFKGTQFIAKTIDRDEWEIMYIKYGQPKDNKKRKLIENDIKRTTANVVQDWINNNMLPNGEVFESFDQAKYRLFNDVDEAEITIPQDEFKEEKK